MYGAGCAVGEREGGGGRVGEDVEGLCCLGVVDADGIVGLVASDVGGSLAGTEGSVKVAVGIALELALTGIDAGRAAHQVPVELAVVAFNALGEAGMLEAGALRMLVFAAQPYDGAVFEYGIAFNGTMMEVVEAEE